MLSSGGIGAATAVESSHMAAFDLQPLRGRAGVLGLVLGDQLDRVSPVLRRLDRRRDAVLMIEAAHESRHVLSHAQRTAMFLAAMRHHALWLRDQGFRVEYARLDRPGSSGTLGGELAGAVSRFGAERAVVVEPGEHRVRRELTAAAVASGVPLEILEDPRWLTPAVVFRSWFQGRTQRVMEFFYREQRRRLGVLMENGRPVSGVWNLDRENREAFGRAPRPPLPPRWEPDTVTAEVIALVGRWLPDLPGRMAGFDWPVTREQALASLEDFAERRLAQFGPTEDAMWRGERVLYHSKLSAALNLGLLSPMECVEAALRAFESGAAPLASVEGFVRQIIGWREFIRGVYMTEGEGYGDRNGLGATGRLPAFYWTGQSDMACLADTIGSVLETAYAHHIPRLMVLANFALLAGITPREVSDWFLGMFSDGVDWVTAPNVVGMALHADGGVVGTKPYAASGKYIDRMSNYCGSCRYSVNDRTGPSACPFNTLYWDFIIRHRETFRGNQRMAMVLKNVDRLPEPERVAITVSAASLKRRLGIDPGA